MGLAFAPVNPAHVPSFASPIGVQLTTIAPDQSRETLAPGGYTSGVQLRAFALERRALVSDSADADVWRRFGKGAAVGFAIGATVGILVQQAANERATDGPGLSPLFAGVVFGIPCAVIGGAIAVRWAH